MIPMSAERVGVVRVNGSYLVNEVFYSIQGEGVMAGVPMVFVRLAKCNLRCRASNCAGFDCDTDFDDFETMSLERLIAEVAACIDGIAPDWLLLTGGEPMLQVDKWLLRALVGAGFRVAIETNGTVPVPDDCGGYIDWICVSPKTAPDTIAIKTADEVKCVVAPGRAMPFTKITAQHKLVSPAFDGRESNDDACAWCVELVKKNPTWRLSPQVHKLLGIR